jgi:hypothetical protein
MVKEYMSDFVDYLGPYQVGLGVPGADALLTHIMRFAMESARRAGRRAVTVKIDKRNAHNCFSRWALFEILKDAPEAVRRLIPWFLAEMGLPAEVLVGDDVIYCVGAAQQGAPAASPAFCIAIQPAVKAMAERLAAADPHSIVIFSSDDGYVHGDPDHVWPALAEYTERLRALNLEVQPRKSLACSHDPTALEGRPEGMPVADGLPVLNVPISPIPGSDYEHQQLALKFTSARATLSQFTELATGARSCHYAQELWTIARFTAVSQSTYWLRNCLPDTIMPLLAEFDEAVLASVNAIFGGIDPSADPLALARVRLPINSEAHGLGIPAAADLADVSFCAALASAIERLGPHILANGEDHPGLFPTQFRQLLGADSFNGSAASPYSTFLSTGCDTATQYSAAWTRMQQRCPDEEDRDLLGVPACDGPPLGFKGLQRTLTRELTAVAAREVKAQYAALPITDRRCVLFPRIDELSSHFITALPFDSSARLSAEALSEGVARYLLLPSPMLQQHAGSRIMKRPGSRQEAQPCTRGGMELLCDAYGDELLAQELAGSAFKRLHDAFEHLLLRLALEVTSASKEVPRLFADLLPVPGTARGGDAADGVHGVLKGAIPDLSITIDGSVRLYELKTLNSFHQWYRSGGDPHVRRASEAKAHIFREMQKRDLQHYPTAPHSGGPLTLRLGKYDYRVISIGVMAEGSEELHQLLDSLAAEHARRSPIGGDQGRVGMAAAALLRRARQLLSCCIVRERASMLRARLCLLHGVQTIPGLHDAMPPNMELMPAVFPDTHGIRTEIERLAAAL